MSIVERIKRFRVRSLNRGGLTSASERPLENADAMAAAGGVSAGAFTGGEPAAHLAPPGYVKSYDEGRPRH
jgi:hypothetical protein